MSLTVFREADVDATVWRGRRVALIGYGNQGRAHALNLRDSGVEVLVGQRPGRSCEITAADGFVPSDVRSAVARGELVIISLPDESASETFATDIAPMLHAGQAIGFVHGFNIRYGLISPPADVDVIMVAPKGPGTLLRRLYVEGRGLPALFAVERDATGQAKRRALGWAAALGCARAGVIETTFADETETDLFGEQVVLCGGVTALVKAAFETLVEAGYEPAFAYLECVHELKQVVDLLYAHGISGMRQRISNTAEYGDMTRGPRIVDEHTRSQMRAILDEIRDGRFAREWIAEHRAGSPNFHRLYQQDAEAPIEQAGQQVRGLMPWLGGMPPSPARKTGGGQS